MRNPKARAAGPHSDEVSPLTLQWIFTLIQDLGGHRQLINERGFSDGALARELGLADLEDDCPPRGTKTHSRATPGNPAPASPR